MQDVWGTGAFQGRTHHQKPSNGSKGQRSYPEKSGVIHKYTCDKVEYIKSTLGNQQGPLLKGSRNIKRLPPPIYDHSIRSGHEINIDNFSIVWREDQNLIRTIKEALYIRVNNPFLNKNIGNYHLPHILDEVLCNSPELKTEIKRMYSVAIPSATHGHNI